MTNKEIKNLCLEKYKLYLGEECKGYKIKVTQSKNKISVVFDTIEYIWIIQTSDMGYIITCNNQFVNSELEFIETLQDCIASIMYYMITRC